jgi:hypothetical protein
MRIIKKIIKLLFVLISLLAISLIILITKNDSSEKNIFNIKAIKNEIISPKIL